MCMVSWQPGQENVSEWRDFMTFIKIYSGRSSENWLFDLSVCGWSSLLIFFFFYKLLHLSGVCQSLIEGGLIEYWENVSVGNKFQPLKLPPTSHQLFIPWISRQEDKWSPRSLEYLQRICHWNGKRGYIHMTSNPASRIWSYFCMWGHALTYR